MVTTKRTPGVAKKGSASSKKNGTTSNQLAVHANGHDATIHPTKASSAGVNYITRSRGEKILDRQAKIYLKMSGKEFLRKYEAGEIEDPDRSEVIRVAMLIPFVKR